MTAEMMPLTLDAPDLDAKFIIYAFRAGAGPARAAP